MQLSNFSLGGHSYALRAVLEHTGTTAIDHYVVYVKKSSAWYCCNDSNITPKQPKLKSNTTSFILFYARSCMTKTGRAEEVAAAAQSTGEEEVTRELTSDDEFEFAPIRSMLQKDDDGGT